MFLLIFILQDGNTKQLITTYPPPEWREKREYNGGRADTWALGVLIYDMLTDDGKLIFHLKFCVVNYEFLTEDFMERLEGVPPQFKPLLRRLLCKDETKKLKLTSTVIARWCPA